MGDCLFTNIAFTWVYLIEGKSKIYETNLNRIEQQRELKSFIKGFICKQGHKTMRVCIGQER